MCVYIDIHPYMYMYMYVYIYIYIYIYTDINKDTKKRLPGYSSSRPTRTLKSELRNRNLKPAAVVYYTILYYTIL